jgi:DnaJ-class molecular chaperone
MDKYYKILGLQPGCNINDIKKKYLNLSKIYHPDKNGGDDTKMKEIVEAYNKLSTHVKTEIIQDIILDIYVNLHDVCHGKSFETSVCRIIKCSDCKDIVCTKCNGDRIIISEIDMGILKIHQKIPCDLCRGIGIMKCLCNKTENKKIFVNIPPGIFPGMSGELSENGHYLGNGNYNKIKFKILYKEDNEIFIRENNNLKLNLKLSLTESLCGFSKEFIHPKLGKFKIENSKILKPGDTIIKSGYGTPFYNDMNKFGDFICVIDVSYPEELTQDQKESIRLIL